MERRYRLNGVHCVAVDECVTRWDVRGEQEGGWAVELCDFRKDRESAARELAVEWCKVLGLASYTFTTFTDEKYGFHEQTIDVATGNVLSERSYIVE